MCLFRTTHTNSKMIINRLMLIAIFNSISHPCVMSDVLTEVMIGVGVDILSDMDIIVMATSTFTL